MKYLVKYRRDAVDQLTAIWLAAADRASITRACDRINRMLQSSPDQVGEARSGSDRVWIVRPLLVAFEIREGERKVIVKTFRRSRPRESG